MQRIRRAALGLLIAGGSLALGNTYAWSGASNDDWDNNQNWNTTSCPNPPTPCYPQLVDDNAIFPYGVGDPVHVYIITDEIANLYAYVDVAFDNPNGGEELTTASFTIDAEEETLTLTFSDGAEVTSDQ